MKRHFTLLAAVIFVINTPAAHALVKPVFDKTGAKVQLSVQDSLGTSGDARKIFDSLRVEAIPGKQVLDKEIHSDDQRFALFCEKTQIMNITMCAFEILAGPTSVINPGTQKASYRVSNATAQTLHNYFSETGKTFHFTSQPSTHQIRIESNGTDFEFYLNE